MPTYFYVIMMKDHARSRLFRRQSDSHFSNLQPFSSIISSIQSRHRHAFMLSTLYRTYHKIRYPASTERDAINNIPFNHPGKERPFPFIYSVLAGEQG